MKKRTYEEVVSAIEQKRRFGNLSGAEITGKMLEKLGNPQAGMNYIHIAGTNGKGSVSAFLCSILQQAGKKVGMFTSPHLMDFRERIQINGEMIGQEDTARIGGMLLEQDFDVYPTMFDYCLAMALLYFKEQGCDAVILETGLGGRMDSTNAVGVPKVTVITKIGYDHMAILGDTLEQIAGEKAGIIKKGTRLVVESQRESVLQVFYDAAKEAGVEQIEVIDPSEIKDCCYEAGEQIFSFRDYENLHMKMLGVHQYENAAAAILAAEAFLANKEAVKRYIRNGIAETNWPGRMEILREKPFLMVDGAHNSNGVAALAESLRALFPGEKFHFIMGVMADKDYDRMIEELLPLAIDFRTVTAKSSRALVAEKLAECIRAKGILAECCEDLPEVLCPENSSTVHKTVVFGSLYFVGEVKEFFSE
ncbi:MAG: bifunctional folylpolyglutamate synthase/dihydrofolate synthase [Roseburia sp.]|nr:bifunctional folylpolyglutamate synthase/dihydrofolate synthase [Roseburia sp.]